VKKNIYLTCILYLTDLLYFATAGFRLLS